MQAISIREQNFGGFPEDLLKVNWAAAAQGCIAGAAPGAAIGTGIAPGVGTAVGGIAGCLAGGAGGAGAFGPSAGALISNGHAQGAGGGMAQGTEFEQPAVPPWAWALIGVGGIVVVGGLAFFLTRR